MKALLHSLVLVLATAPSAPASQRPPIAPLPALRVELGNAVARTEGEQLIVSTGEVERRWRWTGGGLVTVALRDQRSGRHWNAPDPALAADWSYPGLIDDGSEARLVSLTAAPADDQGFTTRHLQAIAEVEYPASRVRVQYLVWAYPGAPGLRTQLRIRALEGFQRPATAQSGRSDHVPIDARPLRRRAVGYYNDTQHRNERGKEILREELLPGETVDWASVLSLESPRDGVLLVKESHKCVNQPGLDTGLFSAGARGVTATGWGVLPEEIVPTEYRGLWANWVVLYRGGEDERELALKVFDRLRYPIDPARDRYIMANTWGSTTLKRDAQIQAREENVLREIASQADLGIDVQQVDDGWQGFDYDSWRPISSNTLARENQLYASVQGDRYAVYPEGWLNIREAARRAGVRLGLWASWTIPLEDLLWNQQQGDFRYVKVDFANLDSYDKLDRLMGRARNLILASGHRVRINWDVTENPPRVGYFFGREYGNIYLENRKPMQPAQVVYHPYLVLRDAWQVSRWLNLNKFQVTVQNVDRVNRQVSDAWKHRHDYAVAQTLMGSPIFFQETQYYSEAARAEIRPLLALYKEHRAAIFDGYVFPVGEEPDNASWSGFQSHDPDRSSGYLMLLRQIENRDARRELRLRFLAGRRIRLRDLRGGEERVVRVGADGLVPFAIARPGDFLFLQYRAE